jgi:hypothetical protein
MAELTEALLELARLDRRSRALIVQIPVGGYLLDHSGTGAGVENKFVISRRQLGELTWEHQIFRDQLSDPDAAARLTALVTAWRADQPQATR